MEIFNLFNYLKCEYGMIYLLVSYDSDVVVYMFECVVMMESGKIVREFMWWDFELVEYFMG